MIRAVVAGFALICCSRSVSDAAKLEERILFDQWQIEQNKTYFSLDEATYRFEIFRSNLQLIDDFNKIYAHEGTIFKVNRFADMSQEEFKRKYLLPKREPVRFPADNEITLNKKVNYQVTTSFDWREKHVVTPVRDQGSAGTCWAFSAVQNLESQWALKGMNLTEFSVEQVVDCDGTEDITKRKADCGVFGGWPYLAYQYVQREGGLSSEEDYPYCCGLGGSKATCYVCPPPGFNKTLCGPPAEYCKESDSCNAKLDKTKFVKGLKVKDWKWFSDNETEIAQHLVEVGPLSVAMNAATLQFYHSGVYEPLVCDPKALDHAVLLTGYGTDKTILGRKKNYWTVKNSWGEKWGEGGYFRIARGKGTCGINSQVTTSQLL